MKTTTRISKEEIREQAASLTASISAQDMPNDFADGNRTAYNETYAAKAIYVPRSARSTIDLRVFNTIRSGHSFVSVLYQHSTA